MSRDHYTTEERTARALERIADTLDDYMDLTLSAQEIVALARRDESVSDDLSMLEPMVKALQQIRERRDLR